MAKVEITRDYKKMKSGLINKENGMIIIPCNYNINEFTMVSDCDSLILDIYILKNTNFNQDIILGIYFKNGNYLLRLNDCLLTLYHYTDFNVLFTHDYNNKDYNGAIIFDNDGKFISYNRINKIIEYNKDMIKELGILTDKKIVYLIDKEFYIFDKTKYPFGNKTYPFVRLKNRIMGMVDSEYGDIMIEADSILEFDYKLDNSNKEILKDIYWSNQELQEKYPKVKNLKK